MVSNMIGVVRATVKFINQLTAEEIDIPLARMSRGKTSAETTQARGPHVMAKVAMYR
jgi:hypothetical protein